MCTNAEPYQFMTRTDPHQDVKELLLESLEDAVTAPPEYRPPEPDPWVRSRIDEVFSSRSRSYRDGLLVLLAIAICKGGNFDVRQRPAGARTIAQHLGREIYLHLHIAGTDDAFANIGKNSKNLIRGNEPAWDDLVEWISSSQTTLDDLKEALTYLSWLVASTSKRPEVWQELEPGALTFTRVYGLFENLLAMKSGGAYQQFSFSALLRAARELDSGGRLETTTKGIDVSDAIARVVGDVQVWDGETLVESYEVTANDWDTKLAQAVRTLRTGKISQVAIVAEVGDTTLDEIAARVPAGHDIAVLDISAEIRSLVGRLPRAARGKALAYLHEYLANERARPELLEGFIAALESHGLSHLADPDLSSGS